MAKHQVSLLEGIHVIFITHTYVIYHSYQLTCMKKRSVRPCPLKISVGTTFQLATAMFCHSKRLCVFARTLLKRNALLTLAGSTLKDLLPSCGWTLYRRSSFRPSVQFIKNGKNKMFPCFRNTEERFWRQRGRKSKHYYSDDLEKNGVTSLFFCMPLLIISNKWAHNNFVKVIFVCSITFDKIFEWNFFACMGYILHILWFCAFSTLGQCVMRLWHHGLHLETRLQLWWIWSTGSSSEEHTAGRSVPLRWRGFRYLGIPLAM